MRNYFRSRIRSFGYAFKGLWIFFSTQANAQIHALAVGLIGLMGWWLNLTPNEWALIILCMALVLVTEAINTALEYLVDLVHPEEHPLAGKVKDVAAGAVLLSVILCGIVWSIIFIPKLLEI